MFNRRDYKMDQHGNVFRGSGHLYQVLSRADCTSKRWI